MTDIPERLYCLRWRDQSTGSTGVRWANGAGEPWPGQRMVWTEPPQIDADKRYELEPVCYVRTDVVLSEVQRILEGLTS